jgi:peroxiredoxin
MRTIVFSVVILVGAALFLSGKGPEGYAIGDKAEDFRLKNVDGNYVSLADFPEAKGFIIVFTCNHCPYAQLYEQRIIDLNRKFKSRGFPVIAINPNCPDLVKDDSFEEMQARAKAKKYTFPYLFDEGQKVFPAYGASRTPHVFLLDKEHIVRYKGAIDDNAEIPEDVEVKYVEKAIEALLKGEWPEDQEMPAVGCPIRKCKFKQGGIVNEEKTPPGKGKKP